MLIIDGSYGEGGGQILRTCLSLSVVTGRPIRLENIRAKRPKPGLRPQHLTCVQAAAAISRARTKGAVIGSMKLDFSPQGIFPRAYRFDIGTAGSIMLVLQTLLLPLSMATAPSRIVLIGGTHVPWSPCFHYVDRVFKRSAGEMGLDFDLELVRWGWYPKGGGKVCAKIRPCNLPLTPFTPKMTGDRKTCKIFGLSAASNLPEHVIKRQAHQIAKRLNYAGLSGFEVEEQIAVSNQPGSLSFCWVEGTGLYGGFTGIGKRGLPAEKVADAAVLQLIDFLNSKANIDRYLSDQLVPIAALSNGISHWSTQKITRHLETVLWVASLFDLCDYSIKKNPDGTGEVKLISKDCFSAS